MEPLPANTSEYLRLYADELGAKILAQFPPLHALGDRPQVREHTKSPDFKRLPMLPSFPPSFCPSVWSRPPVPCR